MRSAREVEDAWSNRRRRDRRLQSIERNTNESEHLMKLVAALAKARAASAADTGLAPPGNEKSSTLVGASGSNVSASLFVDNLAVEPRNTFLGKAIVPAVRST